MKKSNIFKTLKNQRNKLEKLNFWYIENMIKLAYLLKNFSKKISKKDA